MKKTARWRLLALLPLTALAAWLIAAPRLASGPVGPAHAAVDCRNAGCGVVPPDSDPATPRYPPPQVNDALPPAEPPPTF
jgi:hypothetical protein